MEPKFLRLGNQGVFNCKGGGGQQNEMKTNPRAFHLGKWNNSDLLRHYISSKW